MTKTWWCPKHEGKIEEYTIVKVTHRPRWSVHLKCVCGAYLRVTKYGISRLVVIKGREKFESA